MILLDLPGWVNLNLNWQVTNYSPDHSNALRLHCIGALGGQYMILLDLPGWVNLNLNWQVTNYSPDHSNALRLHCFGAIGGQ